ncbi:phage tail tape measure protein [Aureimonas leprariae]|uniref:Phage tail tape measure protein domain-containing protein n=1 Tax=Plantimonas leprariae TaxID=2615207 RepID=A0A7V7TWC2_9HYPH|nr:phage tail tape measure protein [Aureimonas leprariae]KAB0679529.1 hypothetical protein F6X38_11920 [Aureimonas leprariae]
MARTDEQELAIRLEAKIKDFERNMDRAAKTAAKSFNRMEQDAAKSAAKLESSFAKVGERIGSSLKGGLAGVAAIGFGGAVAAARELAKSVAEIGDQAKRAGLSTKAFQELSFVATQTRIPVDAIVDGMKELSLRADEYLMTGSGSAAESFKRLGFTAAELRDKLKDPSALFTEIIGKMEKLNRASRIRIADEIFGGEGGERFVELVDRGSANIKQMIRDANDLGLVLDDKMIAKADEIDKKFNLLATTVSTRLKGAIISAVEELARFIDTFNKVQDQRRATLLENRELAVRQRDAAQKSIGRYGGLFDTPAQRQVAQSQKEIDKIDAALAQLGDQTGDAGGKIDRLGQAADTAAGTLSTLATAGSGRIAEKGDLRSLDRYNAGLTRDVAKKGMLDLIGHTEGTDKGRGYNETLGYGLLTGGDRNLVGMSLKEIRDLQRSMLANPKNKWNSSALGRYQITGQTLDRLMKELNLKGDELFSPEMQDRLAQQLLRRRGNDLGGLRKEWTSLANVPDDTINTALNVTQPTMPGRDENTQVAIDKKDELAKSYQEIVASSTEYVAAQNNEAATVGKSALQAATMRHELDLLNQASAAGLTLTPQMRDQFHELARGMAESEVAAQRLAESQEQAQRTAEQFRGIARDATSSLVKDLLAGKDAGEAFASVLGNIADQLIDMAVDQLFTNAFKGATGGGAGGGLGFIGTIGKFLGFAEGGHVHGPGTGTSDSIPARLSNGEFVVNAKATSKHRALLEAINGGARMPAFAAGGLVTPRPVSAPNLAVGVAGSSPINIASSVTVNANGGTPAQNDELAKKTARAVNDQMRAVVQSELQRAMSPGGIFRNGR